MDEQEKKALEEARRSDDRALIFTNLLNGVPLEQVMKTFQRSEKEVLNIFAFILLKMKNYCVVYCQPPILASCITDSKAYRIRMLSLLPKLNLDKDPRFKRIITERIDDKNAHELGHIKW